MRNTRIMLAIAAAIAITAALLVGSLSDTTEAKKRKKPEVSFEFTTTFIGEVDTTRQIATEILSMTLCAANIGSSGLDGVSAPECEGDDGSPATSDWQIDSFFDIEYRIDFGGKSPTEPTARTIDIELVALSLTGADPVIVLDNVEDVLIEKLGATMTDHRGHVTVLK